MPIQVPVSIYGLARNVGDALSTALRGVDTLCATLPGARALVATNDNSDNTAAVLSSWADAGAGKDLLLLDGIAGAMANRIDRLAAVRNLCLARIRAKDPVESGFVIAMDLDGPNASLEPGAVADILNRWRPEWSGVFANPRQAFYDLYALRHPTWCPGDCMAEIEAAVQWPMRARKRRRANQKFIYQRQFRIDPAHAPIEVDSAFGGFAIYRREALRDCWYGSREADGATVCEHVVLHRQMRAKGARLFILPDLLNEAPPEHLGAGSGRPLPADLVR